MFLPLAFAFTVGFHNNPPNWIGVPIFLPTMLLWIAPFIKRGHDLGISAVWTASIMGAFIVLTCVAFLFTGALMRVFPENSPQSFAMLAILCGPIIWIGLAPGQIRENRYGLPPNN